MDTRNDALSRREVQRRRLLLAGAATALAGCAGVPKARDPPQQPTLVPPKQPALVPPKQPTTLIISLQARPDVNPDIRGRPSPVVVRVLELKTPAAFEAADFFALYDREQATLGAELLGGEQLILKPGESQTMTRKAQPDTRYLGVLAAYRDLEHSVWRASVPVAAPTDVARRSGAGSPEQRFSIFCERTSVRIEGA